MGLEEGRREGGEDQEESLVVEPLCLLFFRRERSGFEERALRRQLSARKSLT